MAKLTQLGRILVDLDDRQVGKTLTRVHVWPITAQIAKTSTASTCAATPRRIDRGDEHRPRAARHAGSNAPAIEEDPHHLDRARSA
jgi:hypothetical protein